MPGWNRDCRIVGLLPGFVHRLSSPARLRSVQYHLFVRAGMMSDAQHALDAPPSLQRDRSRGFQLLKGNLRVAFLIQGNDGCGAFTHRQRKTAVRSGAHEQSLLAQVVRNERRLAQGEIVSLDLQGDFGVRRRLAVGRKNDAFDLDAGNEFGLRAVVGKRRFRRCAVGGGNVHFKCLARFQMTS